MDKGQHLRLFITDGSSDSVIAMSTELKMHGSAQTENSTTKDTTDSSGAAWDENEVVGRTYNIDFSALVASGSDSGGKTFADILAKVDDEIINWKIAIAGGEQNRTIGTVICSGQGKMTNVQATGQVSQQATYSGTINGYGPLIPPAEISSEISPEWNPPVRQSGLATGNYKIITSIPMDLDFLAVYLRATYLPGSGFTEEAIIQRNGDRLDLYASTDKMLYIAPSSGDETGKSFDIVTYVSDGPEWIGFELTM